MKFLKFILIGSLAFAVATPSYATENSSFRWGTIFKGAFLACGAICGIWLIATLYKIKREDTTISIRKKIKSILKSSSHPRDIESHKKQLADFVQQGYLFTTDPATHYASSIGIGIEYDDYIQLAIEHEKPYLIPLLEQLGAKKEKMENYFSIIQSGRTVSFGKIRSFITAFPQAINQKFAFEVSAPKTFLTYFVEVALWETEENRIKEYLSIIEFLINTGADPLLEDAQGRCAYSLIQYGEPNKVRKRIRAVMLPFVEKRIQPRTAETLTTLAAVGVSFPVELAQLCVEYDCGIYEDNLLKVIGAQESEKAAYEGMKEILKDGVPPKVYASIINKADVNGVTPLMHAAVRGHLAVMKELIAKGADIQMCDKANMNVLMHAAQHGHKHVVDYLMQQPSSTKEALIRTQTKPFNFGKAAQYRGIDVPFGISGYSREIYDSAHDSLYIEPARATALILATKNGHVDIVKKLLQEGADKEIHDCKGRTPLYYAKRCWWDSRFRDESDKRAPDKPVQDQLIKLLE